MRLVTAPVIPVCILFGAQLALAQPRGGRRPPRAPAPRGAPAAAPDCNARQDSLSSSERQNEDRKAELAGIEAQIDELIDQLAQLQTRRKRLQSAIGRTDDYLETAHNKWKQECGGSQDCSQYERQVDSLEQRQKPVEDLLTKLRSEIGETSKAVNDLHKRIEPMRQDYKKNSCDDLVPGETTQATINTCTNIFSQWNRMQADLNLHSGRLPDLRSRYQQTASQLDATQKRAKDYETYLAANCQASKQLSTIRKYTTVRDRANQMHQELDTLVKEVTSLRGIKITLD